MAGAVLEIRQTTHEFLFGCNLFALGQLDSPELNRKYEEAFARIHNFATLPFYWQESEPEDGPAPQAAIGAQVANAYRPPNHCGPGSYTQSGSLSSASPVTAYARARLPPQRRRYSQIPHLPLNKSGSRSARNVGWFWYTSTTEFSGKRPQHNGKKPAGKISPIWLTNITPRPSQTPSGAR